MMKRLGVVLFGLFFAGAAWASLPGFAQYQGVEKKTHFFNYLRPLIAAENESIKQQRALLQLLAKQDALSAVDETWLRDLSKRYRVKVSGEASFDFQTLLKRVDTVPPMLAMTQAAIESGWGTSRFARQGNNLFGHWCYTPGCGIVPLRRAAGAGHEVRRFESASQSIRAYLLNLNSNSAYQALRDRRAAFRTAQQPVTASALARTLNHYSERGDAYVKDMLRFIKTNKPLMQAPQ